MKLSSSVYLRKLSRAELFTRLHIIRVLEPLVDRAFKNSEEKKFEEQLDDDPHGRPWHVSFHASQFPGDNPLACPRQSLYRMMDLPSGPFSRRSRMLMNIGKIVELDIVQAFADDGVLLSAAPKERIQTGFIHEDSWLTGSVDCVIRRRDAPLPIEIKTKDRETVEQMRVGLVGPDDSHIFQIKCQLGLIALGQKHGGKWSELQPVTHGFIYYVSRGDKKNEREICTAEFRVDLDERFFEMGIERLKRWRAYFLEDVLPEEPKGKRTTNFGHPMGAAGLKWSSLPCQWCDFKPICQKDFRADIHALSESKGIEMAKKVRPKYDFQKAKQRVIDTWKKKGKL
jgi:CRISPR/Cas system-associated exonuclease Cas4 (RecB family)